MFAQAVPDPVTSAIGGGALLVWLIKWVFVDIKEQRAASQERNKEQLSREVREENLVIQTQYLKKIYKQKKQGNKASRRGHQETHRLLNALNQDAKKV